MKAISPVIATVIIVAVAIAISIAVALWITGLTSSFTGVEKLEIVNAYAEKHGDTYYAIVLVKNTGTKTATIDQIFINGKLWTDTIYYETSTVAPSIATVSTFPANGIVLDTGSYALLNITLTGFNSGQTVSIVVHTASGGQYPATVTLP